MAFSINCNNKGCFRLNEPYLDPKDNKVYCSLCNLEMTNVTHFTKVQMKSLKQFKSKNTNSFSVKCNQCNKEERPKVVDDKIICILCNKEITSLSVPFKAMLKEKLKDVGKDI